MKNRKTSGFALLCGIALAFGGGGASALGNPPPSPHDAFACSDCHVAHGPTPNIRQIRPVIDTPASGPRDVVFLALEGAHSFADGDGVYDGVCEVCHTDTEHHRNGASGDHAHYAGTTCTPCHPHEQGFLPYFEDHPQATTDCGICHRSRDTGEADLVGIHENRCESCHPDDPRSTILGPAGTWGGECDECHNPEVPETGGVATPTTGHRCIACHGAAFPTGAMRTVHWSHTDRANCVVCHGFVPDTGIRIGSGDRSLCEICHEPGDHGNVSQEEIHRRHVPAGLSCLECHAGERPGVDVADGPPVGSSTNVCEICHTDHQPGDFQGHAELYHEIHARGAIGCGACHAQAHLQDDRDPMPEPDDPVRALLDRSGTNECTHCHTAGEEGEPSAIHAGHVQGRWQWCFDCHEGDDGRPGGDAPPVTTPAGSCLLCHTDRTYEDALPFEVHHTHAGRVARVKCYACHQASAPIRGWPIEWMNFGQGFRGGPAGGAGAQRTCITPFMKGAWPGTEQK